MSDIYGDLTYSKGRSKYFGLPVEQEEKTLNALQEKFDTNEAKWDELRTSILDSDFLDTEQQTIDSELQNAHDRMGSIIDTNNFHLAKSSVRKAVDGFTRSENVKQAKEKKASYIAYDEALKEKMKKYKPGEHGGITEEDYNYAIRMWKSKNSGYTHVVNGEIQNKVQSFDVVEQVDFKKYFLDITKNLKASSFDENTQIVINGKQTTVKKAFGSIGDFYRSFEAKGVDDARNLAVMESIMKDHPVMQRLRYEKERDIDIKYGTRREDGLFSIGRDGRPVPDIKITDIPPNYVQDNTVYFAKPMRDANGVPVIKNVDGKQQLQYEIHRKEDLSERSEEEQGMILREAMEYLYLTGREQELDNFAIAFSYKEVETKYQENWKARERYENDLAKEAPIVQTNTAAATTVATQQYGQTLITNTDDLLKAYEEFQKSGGRIENIQTIAGQNSALGVQATAILNYRNSILNNNRQISQGLMTITQADLETQYPSLQNNPGASNKVMQLISSHRNVLNKYTSNNDLPITPFVITNRQPQISPEWLAYQTANNIPIMETDEILNLYGVQNKDRTSFIKASSYISKNKGMITTPDREIQAYGSRSSTTGNTDMDKALGAATNTYFANGQNKVTILQSNNQDATTGTITKMDDVINLIYDAGRKNGINLDSFSVLKAEDLQNGELFTTNKGKATVEDGGIVSKDGVAYSTKVIEVKTADGRVVERITLGGTLGTDNRSNIYNAQFAGVTEQAISDEIVGAMNTNKNIYQIENGYHKPIVINQNGNKYYIQDRSTDPNAEEFTYYHGGRKVTAKKVPIPQDDGVTKMLVNSVQQDPTIKLFITHGQ